MPIIAMFCLVAGRGSADKEVVNGSKIRMG
jgi:hypothetical protein